MKIKKFLFFFLMFFPLAAVLISLPLLPDQIPAHFDMSGQVTRWGSKYETLLFPALAIGFGLFLWFLIRRAARQEPQGHNNQSVSLLASLFALLLFNLLTVYALVLDFQHSETLSLQPLDLYQIESLLAGVLLLVIGNIMPKLRRNSIIGLRTSWSLKNETTWKKSQKFGGITLMASGLLMLLTAFLLKGFPCLLVVLSLLLLSAIICTVYSYRIAQKY